jgi:hypothetical protein
MGIGGEIEKGFEHYLRLREWNFIVQHASRNGMEFDNNYGF